MNPLFREKGGISMGTPLSPPGRHRDSLPPLPQPPLAIPRAKRASNFLFGFPVSRWYFSPSRPGVSKRPHQIRGTMLSPEKLFYI